MKDDLTAIDELLPLDDDTRPPPLPRDQRMMSLLFGIRNEVLSSHKHINEIRAAQIEYNMKVDEACKKIDNLHTKILEPDTGLFARVRDLESGVKKLEHENSEKKSDIQKTAQHVDKLVDWKDTVAKASWYVFAGGLGVLVKYIFDKLFTTQ